MPIDPFFGALVGAGSSLLGGLFGQEGAEDARAMQMQMHQQNIALQREFAKSGIQWRVEDAKKAGIHPLYALGSGVTAYNPSSIQVGNTAAPMASAVSAMGQDISRAINATRTQDQRDEAFGKTVQEMQLQNYTLRNELLQSQIAKLRAGNNPPMPYNTDVQLPVDNPKKIDGLVLDNRRVHHDPGVSSAQEWEDRYGEGISDWIMGPYIAWRDFNYHQNVDPRSGANVFRDSSKVRHGDMSVEEFERIHGRRPHSFWMIGRR